MSDIITKYVYRFYCLVCNSKVYVYTGLASGNASHWCLNHKTRAGKECHGPGLLSLESKEEL